MATVVKVVKEKDQLRQWLIMLGLIIVVGVVSLSAVSWMWRTSWKPWLFTTLGKHQPTEEPAEAAEESQTALIGDIKRDIPLSANGQPESTEPACDPTEQLRTVGTLWLPQERFTSGKSVVLKNVTKFDVFVELKVPKSGEKAVTAIVMSGAMIRLPLPGLAAQMNMSYGDQWCNQKVGFSDGSKNMATQGVQGDRIQADTLMDINAIGGHARLAVSPGNRRAAEGAAVGGVETNQAAPTGQRPQAALGPKQGLVPRPAEKPMPTTWTQAQLGQQQQQSLEAQEASRSTAEQRRYEDLQHKEWAKTLQRDIRLVQNGRTLLLHGGVNGRDAEFVVDQRSELTAVPEGVVDSVDLVNCKSRTWFILGRIRLGCPVKVDFVSLGTIELENVWVAVVPDIESAVLGRNIIGKSNIKRSRDGVYLTYSP